MDSTRTPNQAHFTTATIEFVGFEQVLEELRAKAPDELLRLARARMSKRLLIAEVPPTSPA